jgi:hypothetical protein
MYEQVAARHSLMMGILWHASLIFMQLQLGAAAATRSVVLSNIAAWLICVTWAIGIELFWRARFTRLRARRPCEAAACE